LYRLYNLFHLITEPKLVRKLKALLPTLVIINEALVVLGSDTGSGRNLGKVGKGCIPGLTN